MSASNKVEIRILWKTIILIEQLCWCRHFVNYIAICSQDNAQKYEPKS